MPFFRHLGALLRRNFIYRKRRYVSTIIELILPAVAIGILVAIKETLKNSKGFTPILVPAFYPDSKDALIPYSFKDYLTAFQAQKQCVPNPYIAANTTKKTTTATFAKIKNIDYFISGIDVTKWAVPFVKCDSRECTALGENATNYCTYHVLAVAPSSSNSTLRVDSFVAYVRSTYPQIAAIKNQTGFDVIKVFGSSSEIDQYVTNSLYGKAGNPKVAVAVLLGGSGKTFEYAIRTNATNFNSKELSGRPTANTQPSTSILFDSFAKRAQDVCDFTDDGGPILGPYQRYCNAQYMYNGALPIQRLVDDWIFYESGAQANGAFVAESGVRFMNFPSKEYMTNGFYSSIAQYAPLLVTIGFLFPFASCVRSLVGEKEMRLKELMKMMSITEAAIGWSWWISFFIFFTISAILTTIASAFMYPHTGNIIMFVFWELSFIAIFMFSFFIASFFSYSFRATIAAVILCLVGYFLTLVADYSTGNQSTIRGVSIHPVTAMCYGLQILGNLEDKQVGLLKETLNFSDSASKYTFAMTLRSLFIDIFIWTGFSFYFIRVIQGDYGRKYPWYFPFTVSYWCPGRSKRRAEIGPNDSDSASIPVEAVPMALKEQEKDGRAIVIRGLTKRFGQKTAVDALNLEMYTGQVFALLGDNGAGKTTTINILTGMLSADAGSVTVMGKNIDTQMSSIRENIGICLQHDCLFPWLTVEEHVYFFARVKGLFERKSAAEAKESIIESIENVGLKDKQYTLSTNLSGGMKRKLSVAIAFCGDSKVIFLDEPTSGMDPFSRRFTWNVIRQYRQDRCIILTTHFMDEADLLGDRIAILQTGGKLRCVGSSLFLKKEFGVGYRLAVVKNPTPLQDHSSEDAVKDIVLGHEIGSQLLTNVGTEMIFQLPLNGTSSFASIFEALDDKVLAKEVLTYGVSITTLEEVFLKVSRGDLLSASDSSSPQEIVKAKDIIANVEMNEAITFSRHLQYLFKKRYQNFKRDKKAWFCSVLLPSIISLIGFILVWLTTNTSSRNMVPLKLSLSTYNPKTIVKRNPVPFNYPDSFMCQPGVCLSDSVLNLTKQTGEIYRYCGFEASISNEYSCGISDSSNIASKIKDDGAFSIPLNVSSPSYPYSTNQSSVLKVSKLLPDVFSSEGFASTQYGGIFFTHESSSLIAGQNLSLNYSDVVKSQCNALSASNYTSDCSRFMGLSYLVSTNFTSLHSSLVYQALADEAILRRSLGDDTYSIKSSIHPLPITKVESTLGLSQDSFAAWFLMVLAFPFILGSFAEFIVQERMTKAKHLQTVAGVKPWAYWLSTYVWDTINYQFPCWIVIALLFIFKIEVFTTTARDAVSGTILTILIFGPAAAAFTYCLSFLFKSPSACNIFVVITGFFIGFVGALVSFILRLLGAQQALLGGDVDYVGIATIIEYCLRIHPAFSFSKALFYIQNVEYFALIFNSPDISVWSLRVILIDFLFLLGQIFVYFVLAVYIDRKITNPGVFKWFNIFSSRLFTPSNARESAESDVDVIAEEKRVLSGDSKDDSIVIYDLAKQYGTEILAVNRVSLGIPPGECFGLLGTNGAGKTTTMSILTAEYPPSSGDAFICGHSVTKNPEITRKLIGYCPQFDAHFQNMTGREHVELYAAIKGVPLKDIREAASAKLREVGLAEGDWDKLSATYSGGMKRKLSVACATIGNPKIVFLDEPSTGMDPAARRDMWRLISRMVSGDNQVSDSEKTSVVLTTHSMEECEALCGRIAIMAGGKIRCLGSAQHLKSRFGKGWQVEVKVLEASDAEDDYKQVVASFLRFKEVAPGSDEEKGQHEEVFFNLEQAVKALDSVEGKTNCSSMINEDDANGYVVWKDAKSATGVNLSTLAIFYTQEQRVQSFINFIIAQYPETVLRERNFNRLRFEVPSQGITIASLFRLMESNQAALKLEDYSISQTSLEQVFNVHAAEDDKRKKERMDSSMKIAKKRRS